MGKSLHSDHGENGIYPRRARVFRARLRNGEGAIENYIGALIAGPRGAAAQWQETGCCEKALKPAPG
jgi:hypothetical protein